MSADMPPLPEPYLRVVESHGGQSTYPSLFDATQVHAYARDYARAYADAQVSELVEALQGLLAAEEAEFPHFSAGREAQDAWAARKTAARHAARALIAKHRKDQA